MYDKKLKERFVSRIDIRSKDECWEWKDCRNKDGYGRFSISSEETPRLAHRLAYELATGRQISQNVLVCHKCDNPSCCNPYHLFLGTVADNYA